MNKINYNKKMSNTLKNFSEKKSLLLHACCAPCCSAVLKRLSPFFNITIFYYNPNIMPIEEWEKRKKEFKKLKQIANFNFIVPTYDNDDFLLISKGMEEEKEGGNRCKACIAQRLKKTYEFANANNFDYFCSTLSISPHKDVDYINHVGLALQNGITLWLENDFKKESGFLRSTTLSKQLNIYRQNYCGCKFQ